MAHKVQLFFETDTGEGFSEVYWTDKFADLDSLAPEMDLLITKRLALLKANYYLRYAKAHNLDFAGSALLSPTQLGNPGTYAGATNDIAHQVEECVLISFRATDYINRKRYLHGIGSWVCDGENYAPEDIWKNAMNQYLLQVKDFASCVTGFLHGKPTTFKDIDDIQAQKVTTHRVGRPFGLSVGRHTTHASRLTRAARLLTRSGVAIEQVPVSGLGGTQSKSNGTSRPPEPSI